MGCDYTFTCETCKKHYYLGYGSYSTWIHATNVEKFNYEALLIRNKRELDATKLYKNMNLLECILEHEGHDVHLWSSDWAAIRDNQLQIDAYYGYDVLIDDVSDYEQINMDLEEE